MSEYSEVASLQEHDNKSVDRANQIMSKIDEIKKESIMSEPTHIKNIFEPGASGAGMLPMLMGGGNWGGAGAGAGAGLGAGLLGGILGGALLGGNGGLFGNRGHDSGNYVTPTQLQTGLDAVVSSNQNAIIQQSLGDIKAAIPLAEGQVQLALAGQAATLLQAANTNALSNLAGQAGINAKIAETAASGAANSADIRRDIAAANAVNIASFGGLQQTILTGNYALNSAIRDDGDKTRALITSQYEATLNRQLATAESALLEQRAIGRSRDVEVNVTQTVNQNQMQLQAQQQQQQQAVLLGQIATVLGGLQNAVATNSNLIVGNTGGVLTGSQTANPVNVRT